MYGLGPSDGDSAFCRKRYRQQWRKQSRELFTEVISLLQTGGHSLVAVQRRSGSDSAEAGSRVRCAASGFVISRKRKMCIQFWGGFPIFIPCVLLWTDPRRGMHNSVDILSSVAIATHFVP